MLYRIYHIGDAFLLTWKIDDRLPPGSPQLSELADKALLAFLKTLIELVRNEEFICNFSAAATSRLFKRFPTYNVRIGCGLHCGWAIEGAIGSNRKIDASYLSPHVNFTEYLEASTKVYEVPLLMSEPFYNMLSESAKRYCRQVDRVMRNESDASVSLYTYDADLSINFADPSRRRNINVGSRRGSKQRPSPRMSLIRQASFRHPNRDNTLASTEDDPRSGSTKHTSALIASGFAKGAPIIVLPPYTADVWEADEELLELRHRVMNADFRRKWSEGMGHYLERRWPQAAQCFTRTLEISLNQDGPSKFLLKLIIDHNYEAPVDWKGYRMEG